MEHMEHFANRLEIAYDILESYLFKVGARMFPEDFSRESKLGFVQTCLLIMRGSKRSLQAAIYAFLHESNSELESYSKQAFSKRRQLIKPEAFLTLFRAITEDFYKNPDFSPKCFRGMHLFAIDGTTYNLPNTSELTEVYGVQTTGGESQTQARSSCLYDVLNKMLIDINMVPIKSSERVLALEHLKYLKDLKPDDNLVLLDRGYPSAELIKYFDNNHINYVMRCNKNEFFSEIRKVTEDDKVIHIDKITKKTKVELKTDMRVVQVTLDTGTIETLITNLLDSSFTTDDFKYLYSLRWGIEEKYDDLKNKLKMEDFSGVTPIAVLQDFYATMFLTNLVAFAEMDCEAELNFANQSRERKYEYRINTTMAIAFVKDSFIKLVIEQNPIKKHLMFKRLRNQLLKSVIPIRPGRSYERRRKHKTSKFPQNRKSV